MRLRETTGTCPICVAEVPAEVVADDAVRLVKRCPEHGVSEQVLSREPAYWADLDRYFFRVNGDARPQRDFIVRMTERCNLACPICLASANEADTPDLDLSALEPLLAERRGLKIDLMAAEPTLRRDLPDWIRRVKARGHVAALHTNGLRLADPDYAGQIAATGVDEVFLQFDGFDEEANRALRGRALVDVRLRALANLRARGVATSLITVIARGLNEAQIGETLRFAADPANDHVREVFFMGLRLLGRARAAPRTDDAGGELMPDEILSRLCEQEPTIRRDDVRRFNKVYFALLSAFGVRKCLYVQHYLLVRDGRGGFVPIADLVDLEAMERAAERYAGRLGTRFARHRLVAELAAAGTNRRSLGLAADLVRLENLLRTGMRLDRVPRRFLLLGFITACDPWNFDAQVAAACGKGELSSDGGFVDSGAVANVSRERRFDADLRHATDGGSGGVSV